MDIKFKNELLNYCNIKKNNNIEFFFEEIHITKVNFDNQNEINIDLSHEKGCTFRELKNGKIATKIISLPTSNYFNFNYIKSIINDNKYNTIVNKAIINDSINSFIKTKLDINKVKHLIQSNFDLNRYKIQFKSEEKKMDFINYTTNITDYSVNIELLIVDEILLKEFIFKIPKLEVIKDIKIDLYTHLSNSLSTLSTLSTLSNLKYTYIKLSENINSLFINILSIYFTGDNFNISNVNKFKFSENFTLYDDGLSFLQDSYRNYDGEGTRKKSIVLIKNGVVKNNLIDSKYNSHNELTGNLYRMSYKKMPVIKPNFIIQTDGNSKDFNNMIENNNILTIDEIYYESFNFDFFKGDISFKSKCFINNECVISNIKGNIFNIYKDIISINSYLNTNCYLKKINKVPEILLDKKSLRIDIT